MQEDEGLGGAKSSIHSGAEIGTRAVGRDTNSGGYSDASERVEGFILSGVAATVPTASRRQRCYLKNGRTARTSTQVRLYVTTEKSLSVDALDSLWNESVVPAQLRVPLFTDVRPHLDFVCGRTYGGQK